MSAAPDDQAGRPQAHHVINIPMPARTIARGDGFSYARGHDDNQQWTTSRRRDASSARGSDSRGRGLRSVVLQSVHMHRHAVVCSTPTTQQIPAASAFATRRSPLGWRSRFRFHLGGFPDRTFPINGEEKPGSFVAGRLLSVDDLTHAFNGKRKPAPGTRASCWVAPMTSVPK
jgi:hypothetical protein